jgi:osmotically-inducible protein OsmY
MTTLRCAMTAALAVNLALGGCSLFGGCQTEQCREDASLRDQVRHHINERASLRFFNVDVQSYDGVVYLEGLVDTEIDRGQAEDIAKSVPGVKKVYNALQLNGNGQR